MRPLVLSTINSRHWNANRTYLQLLSCTEMPAPPSSRALLLGGGGGHDFRCAGGVASNVRPLL